MDPVDCERSEELGSSAGEDLVTPAAVHGISVGLFFYIGGFSGPISGFCFWSPFRPPHPLIARRGNRSAALEFRRFCSAPLLCHSTPGRDFLFLFLFLYAT